MQTSRLIVWLKRFIDVAWYLTLLSAVAFVIIVLIPTSETTMGNPIAFELDQNTYNITSNNPALKNPVLTEASGTLRYAVEGNDKFLLLLVAVLSFGFALLIIDRLRRILRAMLKGELLNRSSVNSLRIVGWLLIVTELWRWLGAGIISTFITRTFEFKGVTVVDISIFNPDFSKMGSGLFSGFVILVVAEIIAYSITLQNERDALRDEQALTV